MTFVIRGTRWLYTSGVLGILAFPGSPPYFLSRGKVQQKTAAALPVKTRAETSRGGRVCVTAGWRAWGLGRAKGGGRGLATQEWSGPAVPQGAAHRAAASSFLQSSWAPRGSLRAGLQLLLCPQTRQS